MSVLTILRTTVRFAVGALALTAAVGSGPVAAQSTTTTTTTATATATCTPSVVIDSFGNTVHNNLGYSVSDDHTATSFAFGNNALSVVPRLNGTSYFYEIVNCFPTTTTTNRFILFTLQTASTVRFAVQLETGCGSNGTRIGGAIVEGAFPQPTTLAVDTQTYLTAFPNATLWSIAITRMNTTEGTAPWTFSNLGSVDSLSSCGSSGVTLVTRTDVIPNWTNSTANNACQRVVVDSFTTTGANDLGVTAFDDHTMTSYSVADDQATMVPRNKTSYFYENIALDGKPFDMTVTPNLVFSVHTDAPKGSFQVNAVYGPTNNVSQVTLATLTPGNTTKTYVVPLASYLSATQLRSVDTFSWTNFATDNTSSWVFKDVSLVSNYTTCGVANPVVATPLPGSAATRVSVDSYSLSLWMVLFSVLYTTDVWNCVLGV
ncbi:hypothetical protein HKX48_004312 [Thoreauomyces humboldtii]|nr:hypothetical protein HKX48_004312 [Thoreauomyces humboldtii]